MVIIVNFLLLEISVHSTLKIYSAGILAWNQEREIFIYTCWE